MLSWGKWLNTFPGNSAEKWFAIDVLGISFIIKNIIVEK